MENCEPPSRSMTPKAGEVKEEDEQRRQRGWTGRRSGRVTFVQTRKVSAPRERAACSSLGSRLERALPTMRMIMVVL
ncbi:MAG: hypothetical protein MZV64_19485 [Ignavibacteriales bacterium]|nr:hypothetical protein [Ignavibacteriales bacterium]